MQKIHLSFDIWGTLISVNPETKKLRSRFLADHFKLEEKQAHEIYSGVKRGFDDDAYHLTNVGKSTEECFDTLVQAFGATNSLYPKREAQYVRACFEDIFRQAPPTADMQLVGAMRKLKATDRYTMSVGSNSNFVCGPVMMDLIDKMYGPDLFEFSVHSDQIGYSKPHPKFYECIHAEAARFSPDVIIHAGDNRECDVAGPNRAGIRGHYVENPSVTLGFVLELLNKGYSV